MDKIMNVYNPDATCPKCGCTGIKNLLVHKGEYISGRNWTDKDMTTTWFIDGLQAPSDIETILRTCLNCGFQWFEAAIDDKVGTGRGK